MVGKIRHSKYTGVNFNIYILISVQLKSNINILEDMQPKNINDFAPLAIIATEKLKRIQEIAIEEANKIPNNHRIYYFSELLQVRSFAEILSLVLFYVIFVIGQGLGYYKWIGVYYFSELLNVRFCYALFNENIFRSTNTILEYLTYLSWAIVAKEYLVKFPKIIIFGFDSRGKFYKNFEEISYY